MTEDNMILGDHEDIIHDLYDMQVHLVQLLIKLTSRAGRGMDEDLLIEGLEEIKKLHDRYRVRHKIMPGPGRDVGRSKEGQFYLPMGLEGGSDGEIAEQTEQS